MITSMLKKGCRVGFFGLGKSCCSLLRTLPIDRCEITLRSDGKIDAFTIPSGICIRHIFEGKSACRDIDEDIIFFSPSVRRDRPELLVAEERGVIFTSDAELFFEENKTPVFAVTGSDGKSTTATLTNLLLNAGGYKSTLSGNIGVPMSQNLDNGYDFFVCELSSFMLTYTSPRSRVACITNTTPNHLDWHKSYEEYIEAKRSIATNTERLIISDGNTDITGAYGIVSTERDFGALRKLYKAEIYMTAEDGYICKNGERLIEIGAIRRREEHNLRNLMMAIAMTDGLVDKEQISCVASDFEGLSHRCEMIISKNSVDYIDSSIDSTPARTVQTLKSLDRDVVLILGGRGKGLDYGELVPTLKKYAKRVLICGENAEDIYSAVKDYTAVEITDNLEDAVRRGVEYARRVGTLLLSPASTSFDRFKNYADRGDAFKKIILKYT